MLSEERKKKNNEENNNNNETNVSSLKQGVSSQFLNKQNEYKINPSGSTKRKT